MRSEILDSEGLCLKITDMLEQEPHALSGSLQGEILDAYKQLLYLELDNMQEIRRLLPQIGYELQNQ